MRLLITAAATAFALGLGACSQGTQEEAGEAADTAAEQATTGETDLGQGPAEEAGEAADEAADGADPVPGDTTAPPTTP
jgi:hypothetical protein